MPFASLTSRSLANDTPELIGAHPLVHHVRRPLDRNEDSLWSSVVWPLPGQEMIVELLAGGHFVQGEAQNL